MKPWYQIHINQVETSLNTDLVHGLTSAEVSKRQQEYGFNELTQKPRESIVHKFIKQFKDFLVLILLAASAISILVGDLTDSLVIIAIVILNASLGTFQEFKAESALQALKKLSAPSSKVIRDGHLTLIPSRDLVPGDIVLLEAGDYVPADLRIIETANLKVEEASLTGEAVPTEKNHLEIEGEVTLGDRYNIGFMSTVVTYGRGKGIVIKTGMGTEIGKIAEMIQSNDNNTTPLQQKLEEFGKTLGLIGIAVCAVVFIMGIYTGYQNDGGLTLANIQLMLMTAISLAVAAIPEGLPTIVTIVLALGMQRMAKRNAIVKKLHAVETLGSTTVICSDKTGTLTQNQMTVVAATIYGKAFEISGEGYKPEGDFTINQGPADVSAETDLQLLLRSAALCNDAELKQLTETGIWTIIGDPTEGALLSAAAKGGYTKDKLHSHRRIAEIPFDSLRKMMTTFHTAEANQIIAFAKGAPDILLSRCTTMMQEGVVRPITKSDVTALQQANKGMASKALRVLAFAYRKFDHLPDNLDPAVIEKEMTFIGLLGMIDPARPEAKEAIKTCTSAGIRTIMITGDHPDTAYAIAKNLGIANHENQVLTGKDLLSISESELRIAVTTVSVFARVSPEHKMSIVDALRANNQIVAMTGDGVNDAPALKKAHIGIAMGITGTDVTKEAADMVITDDNFASIIAAVEEGRVIFANIKKFIYFLLSCNASEVLVIFFAMLLGWPLPLLPIQLLWLNLVTDAFPALALGMEKQEPNIMKMAPRTPDEPLLSRNVKIMIGLQSFAMAAAVLVAFSYGMNSYNEDLTTARTFAFITIMLSQIICAYSARSENYSAFALGFFSNKYLNMGAGLSLILMVLSIYGPLHLIFKTVEPQASEWVILVLLALTPYLTTEVYKILMNHRQK
ncbi:MAG: cation-translocating P-type ATPase [Sporomusaceae bacterium]|nr:cation-translocating P-type ATPase [Sporomusaceae bacterium]